MIASCVTLGALGLPLLTYLSMRPFKNPEVYNNNVPSCGQHGSDGPLHGDNDHVLLRPARHIRGQYYQGELEGGETVSQMDMHVLFLYPPNSP